MTILEDHNRQLEAQLVRLRQLVNSDSPSSAVSTDVPTVPAAPIIREIVAANLHNNQGPTQMSPDKRPVPPQFLTGNQSEHNLDQSEVYLSAVPSDQSSDGDHRMSATSGSLNLSQHNAEVVQVIFLTYELLIFNTIFSCYPLGKN